MTKWARLAIWSVLAAAAGYVAFPESGRTPDEMATVLAVVILATILVTRTVGHVLLFLFAPPEEPPTRPVWPTADNLLIVVVFYGAIAAMLTAFVSLYLAILPLFLAAIIFVGLGMSWAALGTLVLSGKLLLLGSAAFIVFVSLTALTSRLARNGEAPLSWLFRELIEKLAATAHA